MNRILISLAVVWYAGFAFSQDKLTASDAATGDYFGSSVSIFGDTVVVGAWAKDDGGSAYMFTRDLVGVWSEQAKLTVPDAAANDYFGSSVSISGDTVVVSAHGDDDNGSDSGSAYVFTRDLAGVWSEQAKLTASDAAPSDAFGYSVSISGNTVVVAAVGDDDGGLTSGSAYVFTRDLAGVWSEQAKLTASDAAQWDNFGNSVSISEDSVVVGAWAKDDDGLSSGSAYVFTRDLAGVWSEQAKLSASDAAPSDAFGYSVSISGDAVVIGAHRRDDGGGDSGAAYVFTRDLAGVWIDHVKLTAPDAATGDFFGCSVSIYGNPVVVGAHLDDHSGTDSGSAYVYISAALIFSDGFESGSCSMWSVAPIGCHLY